MLNSLSKIYSQLCRRWAYGVLSVIIAAGIVVSNPLPGQAASWLELLMRGIQVIQLSTLSDRQEVALGQQINEQLTSREFRLYRDSNINSYVQDIGEQLVPYSDRPNIPYRFQVVQDDRVNAFATMGGFVYVTTGLMRTASNEAELASVIGHEIGHIAGRHSVEQMREAAIAQGVASAAGLDRSRAVQIGVELALRRPNSRQDEFEADTKGLETLREAGYAPIAVVDFMQKLLRQSSVPTFLSTHPATQDRIRALRSQIDEATATRGYGLDSTAYRQQIRSLIR